MTLLDGSGKAPAIVSELAFSKARPAEMVKVDYEILQPNGADEPLYHYVDPVYGGMARRFWSLRKHLLVGGFIRDQSDAMHLARDFGVTHVLSFESERTDHGKWSQPHRAECGFEDNGKPPTLDVMCRAVKWVLDLPKDRSMVLYCHCRLGYSLGPSAAYLALRARWYMNREVAQKYAGRRQGGDALLAPYLLCIDQAIEKVTGRNKDQ